MVTSSLPRGRLEADLVRIASWIALNGLRINIPKTQLMIMSRRSKRQAAETVSVGIDNVELARQDSVKYLRVEIDKELTWRKHTDKVSRTCLAKLAAIRRAEAYLASILKMLYKSFVMPHLDYCSVVWSHCGVTQSNKLEHVQNYALRIISRKPPRTPSVPLVRVYGPDHLLRRRRNHTLQQVHRCLLGQLPPYMAG